MMRHQTGFALCAALILTTAVQIQAQLQGPEPDQEQQRAAILETPTRKLSATLDFSDDLDWHLLDQALVRQLEQFSRRKNLSPRFRLGQDVYSLADLRDSALLFRQLLDQRKTCSQSADARNCDLQLARAINESFSIYVPTPGPQEPGYNSPETTLFTAYYSPDLEGSLTQDTEHPNPIYALPKTEADRTLTREQIDFDKKFAGKKLELIWVRQSLFDIYLLQVQGGGRVRVKTPEGYKSYYLSYAGANGQPFRFLFKYMLEKGMLSKDNLGIPAQRKYIAENPDKARAIFASNPSYVYFKFTETEPLGMDSIPLTEGRSLAIDHRIYKYTGFINFVRAKKPGPGPDGRPNFTPFSRFFIAQDTGGAIRGNARADMYFGYGDEAEFTAYNTKVQGEQYFLIKK